MSYQRKTRDYWEIQGNCGYGFECENTETTLKDARRSVKEYRDNVNYPIRIVKKRERITCA